MIYFSLTSVPNQRATQYWNIDPAAGSGDDRPGPDGPAEDEADC